MNNTSWKEIDSEVPWIFIPLCQDDAKKVYFWIKRIPETKEADERLAKECEEAIQREIKALNLKYNNKEYGPIKMGNIRIFSGSDGIAIPETCFIEPCVKAKRITNPLRPIGNQSIRPT